MKCKHCDGTGTTNWCVNGTFKECPYCGGTGEVDRFNAVDVLKVMEMIKKPHTNKEWLCSCTDEQLAEFLAVVINTNPCGYLLSCNECGLNDRCREDDYPSSKEAWGEWLKQPYREG